VARIASRMLNFTFGQGCVLSMGSGVNSFELGIVKWGLMVMSSSLANALYSIRAHDNEITLERGVVLGRDSW